MTRRKVLLLHGSRQTGQLLLGRIEKFRKKLLNQQDVEIVAIDGPFPAESLQCWWQRDGNTYTGLEESVRRVQDTWDETFVGLMGFSQGARLAHLLALANLLPSLRFVLMFSNYDAPIPDNFLYKHNPTISVPSLHVWGETDRLILPDSSTAVKQYYLDPQCHVHPGGHHVPMQASHVQIYLDFIRTSNVDRSTTPDPAMVSMPDDETRQQQVDEVQALQAIFPTEFHFISSHTFNDHGELRCEFPVSYFLDLPQSDEGIWPKHPMRLRIQYPPTYPTESLPQVELVHDNNGIEFSSSQNRACLEHIRERAQEEAGMPCVLSTLYAAREYFEQGMMIHDDIGQQTLSNPLAESPANSQKGVAASANEASEGGICGESSAERIRESNLLGLTIAESILSQTSLVNAEGSLSSKGGSWLYTIGLVGKPSAGKSTVFNTATGFARQRQTEQSDGDTLLGGASMAPHPFTTIDPNVGYCLVPAPVGSCPEDEARTTLTVGCTHGRDNQGRRLIPILLKDVAGLVPGAYQGRGRGNQFLNDLCDADVLVHVLDASGSADTEGNIVTVTEGDTQDPQQDMAWIRNELIEWVHSNLLVKWDAICRKGRDKLAGMFSGYGQSKAMTWTILNAVEQHFLDIGRERALDNLDAWDSADIHLLVSAFLGVRFPIALALNKCDIPSSKKYVDSIQNSLPIHGSFIGTPLSARSEMFFVKHHIESTLIESAERVHDENEMAIPEGTWNCLQSAVQLREPVLVFPVEDTTLCTPLAGLSKRATSDPSLPSPGMISCLTAAGGTAPSLWNRALRQYSQEPKRGSHVGCALRDVLLMKPGSTVEDVFNSLKRLGVLGGEFVRAEATSDIGVPAKPIPKNQLMSKKIRIIKIMTSKRTSWQK